MKIIEAENLSFSYEKDSPILKGLSFSIEEGTSVSIIGHNGSGKSTLAKVLAGLNANYEGNLKIFGQKMEEANLYGIQSRMGLVFQNPDNQFVGSTVEDDIAFGLENRQVPTKDMPGIITQFAGEVGMLDYLKKAPENLSGGQKQRVAIAGVLAMKPDLLILDEATSMLDPLGKKEILSLIRGLKKDNPALTILSITHDVEEAYLSDYVIVLNEGNLILQGTPDDVFARDEELEKIHLEAPFFLRLVKALREEGIEIPSDVKNEEELEEYLCR